MKIKLAESDHELEQILQLQEANHFSKLTDLQKKEQGFVTVQHELALLRLMNEKEQHVIAVDEDRVIGYALVMIKDMQNHIPVLQPMFKMFEKLSYGQMKLNEISYYVMGQICIEERYRGQGVFQNLYAYHKQSYRHKYKLCLTEVSTSNARSMRAHLKVGFETIHSYRDKTDEWNILCWDWS